jgi:hypothetical protein
MYSPVNPKAIKSCAAMKMNEVTRGSEYSLRQISTITFLTTQFSDRLGRVDYLSKDDLVELYPADSENRFETNVSLLWAVDSVWLCL